MKKIISLLLVALMCLSFAACSSGNSETPSGGENTENNGGSTNDDSNKNDSVLQERYDAVVEEFNHYVEDGHINSPDWMYGNAAATYLYNEFKALGDYKDCADYLAKFKVIPDVLTEITIKETDNFGQTTERNYQSYIYTKYGECPDLTDLFTLIAFNGDWRHDMMDYDYLYDENNQLIGLRIFAPGRDGNPTITEINFEYDDKENLVKAHFVTSDNEYTNTYTYDEENRLISSDVIYSASGHGHIIHLYEGYFAQYEYDEAGNLSREIICDRDRLDPTDINEWPRYVEYTYDENGYLSQTREGCDDLNQAGAYRWTTTKVYTVDENGKILSAEVTEGDETYTLVYHYGTQCCYTGE